MNEPRIVLFDLESLPDLDEAMKKFPQLSNYPGLTLKADINSIICFGYKIVGEKQVHCINAWDFPTWKKDVNDDRALIKAAIEILKDADAIVTHNGKRFDEKFLRTRMLIHKMNPLPKIPHVDTCAIARSNLYLFNNKLDTLGDRIVNERKLENGGWDLWVKVRKREPKAMKLMEDYCKQDVALLSKVFESVKHLAKNIPNYNLFTAGLKPVCPSCGGTRLQSRGKQLTKTRVYNRYQCQDCASWSQSNLSGKNPR